MTEITCETQGHLWGALDKCVMCGTPKPQEALTSNERVSDEYLQSTLNEISRARALDSQMISTTFFRMLLTELIERRACETTGDGWIACSDRMPTHGLKVMAYFRNKLGKGRTVFANHIEKFKERADNYEIDPDTPDDWFDTDESGESYIPEGWYENSETHEQELAITDEILFWRPLLSPPEQVKTNDDPHSDLPVELNP